MKKILMVIISLLMVFTSLSFADNGIVFSDMTGHWSKDYVLPLTETGIIGGYEDGTFRPDAPIKADEFITLCIKSLDGVTVDTQGNTGYWATPYINKAYELGIITDKEMDEGNFERQLSRQDMASFVIRTLKQTEDVGYPTGLYKAYEITDYTRISDGKHQDIMLLYTVGLTNGKPGKVFDPQGTLTRGEASVVLYRMLNKDARQPVQTKGIPSVDTVYDRRVGQEIWYDVPTTLFAPIGADGQPDVEAVELFKHFSPLEGMNGTEYIKPYFNPVSENMGVFVYDTDITDMGYLEYVPHVDVEFVINMSDYATRPDNYTFCFRNRGRNPKYENYDALHGETLDYLYDYLFEDQADEVKNKIISIYDQGQRDYESQIQEVLTLNNGRSVQITSQNDFTVFIGQKK